MNKSKPTYEELIIRSSLLDQVHNAVITINFDNIILDWNSYATKLYQWSKEEAVGKNIIELLSPSEMIEEVHENFKKLNRDGHWFGEFNVLRKDGSTIPVNITNTYLRDENLEAIGFIGISQNITEQKKIERNLVDAKLKAEESNLVKQQFLTNMNHEFRTPMNGIIGLIEICKMTNKIGSEDRKSLELISNSATNLMDVLSCILDLTKFQSGSFGVNNEKLNLNEILKNVCGTFDAAAALKDIDLSVSYVNEMDNQIYCDKLRLSQVLSNLIGNAIKFTETGQINIIASSLNDSNINKQILIEVIDSGIGIDQDDQAKIFLPFQQINEGNTRAYQGLGAGLHLSKQLIGAMNGEIGFESELGKGSRFWFSLPADKVLAE